MLKPNKLTLTVYSEFKASHSLQGFETPHFHLWKIEASFSTPLPFQGDRLIDLVFLQNTLHEIFAPIEGKYLNEALAFSPTSEMFSEWLWAELIKKLPTAPLTAIGVTLCNLEGRPMGTARLSR